MTENATRRVSGKRSGPGRRADPGPQWAGPILEHLERSGHDGSCPYPCPVCAALSLIRQMRPEVKEHLAAAGRELLLATKAVLESLAEAQAPPPPEQRVERIPFD